MSKDQKPIYEAAIEHLKKAGAKLEPVCVAFNALSAIMGPFAEAGHPSPI